MNKGKGIYGKYRKYCCAYHFNLQNLSRNFHFFF